MAVAALQKRLTPEDLLTMPDGEQYELVDGELVEKSMGTEAGCIAAQVVWQLEDWKRCTRAGHVFTSDASYQCFPETPERVRRPNVSFIRSDRLPGRRIPKGHCRIPPDLAVEVVSPNDGYSEVRIKVEEYLRAGFPVVWLVDPETRTVEMRRADGTVTLLHEGDELTTEEVVPGFRCLVAELFPG